MRYVFPVHFRLNGRNIGEDNQYATIARTFLGKMIEQYKDDPTGMNWSYKLADGTELTAYIPSPGMTPIISIYTSGYQEEKKKKIIEHPEYMYVLLSGGGQYVAYSPSHPYNDATWTNKIVYILNGSTGDFIKSDNSLDAGILDNTTLPYGFVVRDGEYYWSNGGNLLKGRTVINSSFGAISGATGSYIVSTGTHASQLVDWNGNYIKTVNYPPQPYYGSYDYGANNYGIQVYVEDGSLNSGHIYIDYNGVQKSYIAQSSYNDLWGSAGKYLFMYPDYDGTSYWKVVNSEGVLITSINMSLIPYSYQFQRMAVTSSRVFFLDSSYYSGTLYPAYVHSYTYNISFSNPGEATSFSINWDTLNTVEINSAFNGYSNFQSQFMSSDILDWSRPKTEIIEE